MGEPQVDCCGLDWSRPSCAAVRGPRGATSAWLPGSSRKGSRPKTLEAPCPPLWCFLLVSPRILTPLYESFYLLVYFFGKLELNFPPFRHTYGFLRMQDFKAAPLNFPSRFIPASLLIFKQGRSTETESQLFYPFLFYFLLYLPPPPCHLASMLLPSHFSRVRLCATPSLGFSRQETGVGCHFLLQCIKVKSESEVAQSCLTL